MHIKEIVLDGFKSYANRTVISGFDPSFNAITGLNGSGKSNILDAICFVLGISNLSQVRVSTMNELIYKQGSSRVTRATVTIIFDNSDTARSPIGYEQYTEITVSRQIMIGGKNKYLINGHTAQLNKVQNMFHSIGLNIASGHFLVLQGKITRVVGMKAIELLGMIEEAAGTKQYEYKKLNALKLIEKKQIKVNEFNTILQQEIIPKIESLKAEQANFVTYQKNDTELKQLTTQWVTCKIQEKRMMINDCDNTVQNTSSENNTLQQLIDTLNIELNAIQNEISTYHSNEAILLTDNTKLQKLEKHVKELKQKCITVETKLSNQQNTVESETKETQKYEKQKIKLNTELQSKQGEHEKLSKQLAVLQDEVTSINNEISALRSSQLGVATDNNDSSGGIAGTLITLNKQLSSVETEIITVNKQIRTIEKEISDKQKSLNSDKTEYEQLQQQCTHKQTELQQLQSKLNNSNDHSTKDKMERSKLEQSVKDEERTLQNIQQSYQQQAIKLSNFNFEYNTKVIDSTKIKGVVGKLITVKDSKYNTAIEIAAGARLYNVVVDDESTGKLLLEKGELKKRVTLIPLSTIATKTLNPEIIALAKSIDPNVVVASEVLQYNNNINKAIQYIFGTLFICNTIELANKIAFHPQIRTRVVTLDGDVADPSGTVSGGSIAAGPSILQQYHEFCKLDTLKQDTQQKIQKLQQQIESIIKKLNNQSELNDSIALCEREMQSLQRRLQQTTYGSLQTEIESSKQQLTTLHEKLTTSNSTKIELNDKIKELNELLSSNSGANSRELHSKHVQKQIDTLTKKLKLKQKSLSDATNTVDNTQSELTDLQNEIDTVIDTITKTYANIESTNTDIESLQSQLHELKSTYETQQKQYEHELQQFQAKNNEIKLLQEKRETMSKQLKANEQQYDTNQKLIERTSEHIKVYKQELHELCKKYDIDVKSNTTDTKQSIKQLVEQIKQIEKQRTVIEQEQKQLQKHINTKVMLLFQQYQTEYDELMNKKSIVEQDKVKIENVMKNLDIKKIQQLHITHKNVNENFNSIMSTLLPGTSCKLVYVNDNILNGLEIKIAFNNVWKDNLSDLSGGQRSLLALSLILSLLLYKPTAMYILDEIDSALDLSHTQNIGVMVRKYFPQSQFILVSLKEGMFNNANVIFRTKFIDGVSTVQRTANVTQMKQGTEKFGDANKENIAKKAKI